MSVCSVGRGGCERDNGMYEILEWHVKREKRTTCNFCYDTITAGESLLLTVWGDSDCGAVRELCSWCEDAFKDSDGIIPAYADRDSFVDAMMDRMGELDEDDVKTEFADWMSKPPAFRETFTRLWPDVVEELFNRIRELEE